MFFQKTRTKPRTPSSSLSQSVQRTTSSCSDTTCRTNTSTSSTHHPMTTTATRTKPNFRSHSLGKGILKDENRVSFKPSPDMVLKHNMSMLNKAYSSDSLFSSPFSSLSSFDSTTSSSSSMNGLKQHETIIGNGYFLCETYEFEDFDNN